MSVSNSQTEFQEHEWTCFVAPIMMNSDDSWSASALPEDCNDIAQSRHVSKSLAFPKCLEELVHVLRSLDNGEAVQLQNRTTPPSSSRTMSLVSSSISMECYSTINVMLTIVPGDTFAFSLNAPSDMGAMAGLDLVTSLHDECFTSLQISHGPFHDKLRHAPPLGSCPYSLPLLAGLLSQELREVEFSFYSFTSEQTRLILSHNAKYRLKLNHCQLELPEDMEAIQGCGPTRLTLCFGDAAASHGQDLFCRTDDWLGFLNVLDTNRLQVLSLCEGLVDTAVCQRLGELPLRHLELRHVKLADGGACLIKSVKEDIGPRGLALLSPLYIARRIFRKPYHWSTFFEHLRGNQNLECLVLDGNTLQQVDWWAMATSLNENVGLKQLRISYGLYITGECWTELMSSIAIHPRLERLFFEIIVASPGWNDSMSILHRTKSLAELVRNNRRIHDIGYSYSFDRQAWEEQVTPELEHNRFIRRYSDLQQVHCQARRASLFGASMNVASKDPKLLWLALSMNQDVISELAN